MSLKSLKLWLLNLNPCIWVDSYSFPNMLLMNFSIVIYVQHPGMKLDIVETLTFDLCHSISCNYEQAPTRNTTTFWDLMLLSSDDSRNLTKTRWWSKSCRFSRYIRFKHLAWMSRTLLAYSYACYREKR